MSRHLARCFPRPRGAGGLELAPVVARASVWLALTLPTRSCRTNQPTGTCSATKEGVQTTRSCRTNQPTRTCSATNQRLQTNQPELAVQPTRGCRPTNQNLQCDQTEVAETKSKTKRFCRKDWLSSLIVDAPALGRGPKNRFVFVFWNIDYLKWCVV